MVGLPVIQRLDVDNYGLYPGPEGGTPGLHVEFMPGLTLVLGANGLGKTTLVTLLFRMLTGPFDIPKVSDGEALGNKSPESAEIPRPERRIFAARVVDKAAEALAGLTYTLGTRHIEVTRQVHSLELQSLIVNGVEQESTEERYQDVVQEAAGLAFYGDWILILRHLVFYFEDRRALVWDPVAQSQLLRLLFLNIEESREWSDRERDIFKLDSSVRNLGYMLRKEEKRLATVEASRRPEPELRQQLALLQSVQEEDQERLATLNDQLMLLINDRQRVRVNSLRAEQVQESTMRKVERLQLETIAAAFPGATEAGRYIVGHLLAEDQCITCGTEVPELAESLRERVQHLLCPICGSDGLDVTEGRPTSAAEIAEATERARAASIESAALSGERGDAEAAYSVALAEVTSLTAMIDRRAAEIRDILSRLPPSEHDIHGQVSDLTRMRSRLEVEKHDLTSMRDNFQEFIADVRGRIEQRRDSIKEAFDRFAKGFLVEDCELKWLPKARRIGQSGEQIEMPSFEVDLTGAGFLSPARRSGPEQVSESQREFIDISFRMALMEVAGQAGGTLVIDAPESSLDAVFVTRAADVLTRFSTTHENNRLVVTSNLIDGDLIPKLLGKSGITSSSDPRVVDLLSIAAPTRATRDLDSEYQEIRQRLFSRAAREART
ncbi:hypothetical protein C7C45_08835 [Micromonospora arborensis]|uniref:Rad50/SbcC-type AAA domain-containing protein n=1 Tax=Micromonospora arborensis TaxID=2116518 RepID=A0A318NQU1_9ACTN|nr:ATP-binding protein [Micromonospora arborensis]PYC72531.1 hypothetical protein C7C45_08835 [Micromonospora arborensis]